MIQIMSVPLLRYSFLYVALPKDVAESPVLCLQRQLQLLSVGRSTTGWSTQLGDFPPASVIRMKSCHEMRNLSELKMLTSLAPPSLIRSRFVYMQSLITSQISTITRKYPMFLMNPILNCTRHHGGLLTLSLAGRL